MTAPTSISPRVVRVGDKAALADKKIVPEVMSTIVDKITIIDSPGLAARLTVPATWVRDQVRSRAADPIPCLRFGRYVRFRWNSPELNAWIERRAR